LDFLKIHNANNKLAVAVATSQKVEAESKKSDLCGWFLLAPMLLRGSLFSWHSTASPDAGVSEERSHAGAWEREGERG
jgi:hypothetical protein